MFVCRKLWMGAALVTLAVSAQCVFAGQSKAPDAKSLERGRYIARIAGCNDCHTPGYAPTAGTFPRKSG